VVHKIGNVAVSNNDNNNPFKGEVSSKMTYNFYWPD